MRVEEIENQILLSDKATPNLTETNIALVSRRDAITLAPVKILFSSYLMSFFLYVF